MYYIIEILIVLSIIYLFYRFYKPKFKYLLLGFLFVTISLILQLPIRMFGLEIYVLIPNSIVPSIFFATILVLTSELTKYFSLKRFMKTRSPRNATFFGMGWVGLESLNIFSVTLYTLILSFFPTSFNPAFFIDEKFSILTFVFLLVVNFGITTLVIISITKRKLFYLFYAIIFSIFVYVGLNMIMNTDKLFFMIFTFLFSLYIVFLSLETISLYNFQFYLFYYELGFMDWNRSSGDCCTLGYICL